MAQQSNSKIPPGLHKPCVGIIYSDSDQSSAESKNLAHYLGGLLARTGYAKVFMVPFRLNGNSSPQSNRFGIVVGNSNRPVEIPVSLLESSEIEFRDWKSIDDCHLLIVTLNSPDSEKCAERLKAALQSRKGIPVFGLQRGVRNNSILCDAVSSQHNTVIDGVVGFAVICRERTTTTMNPSSNSEKERGVGNVYYPSHSHPSIIFERLTKEAAKIADGPTTLLEKMELNVYFRKTLTPYSWGVLVFESLFSLNALTGGSLRETLYSSSQRRILAMMIRESSKALTSAARGGKWAPDFLLYSPYLSPWLWEMILILPDPFFLLIAWCLAPLPLSGLPSPLYLDLVSGRECSVQYGLGELVETGNRNSSPMPVCDAVLTKLKQMNATPTLYLPSLGGAVQTNNTGSGSASLGLGSMVVTANSSENVMMREVSAVINNVLSSQKNSHASVAEFRYWLVRGLALLSFLPLLYFIFVEMF